MKKRLLFLLLFLYSFGFSQETYDNCSSALALCPSVSQNVDNIGATISMCSTCEDFISSCFTPINSIWLKFITTAGGNGTLQISNIQFQPVNNDSNSLSAAIIQATTPCDNSTYSYIDCMQDQTTGFIFVLTGLLPNTTYYVLISGTQNGPGAIDPSEAKMDIVVNGPAVSRAGSGVVIGASQTVFCQGESTEIIADTSNCPGQKVFDWYKNGVFWFTSVDGSFYTDELQLNDQVYIQCNCFDVCPTPSTSNTLTFTVLDFSIDAGLDTSIQEGQSVMLNGQTNGVNYFWTPADHLSDPNILNPIATPPVTTTYFLTASNGTCQKTDEMVVNVSSSLEIPTVFSPNGDGINDTWEIIGIDNYPNVKIEIYDRWGQRVFQTVGYNSKKFWNGTSPSGKPLVTSTYYYSLDLDDGSNTVKKGPITIMR